MKNIYLRLFQVLAVVLLAALVIATFVSPDAGVGINPESVGARNIRALGLDHFYSSSLNVDLWLALCILMLLAVFVKGIRGFAQKCLHFLLVLIFLLVFFDKTVNERFLIPIREGQEVNLAHFLKNPSGGYDIPLRLLKFDVQLHPGSDVPAAYKSRILVNRTDTTILAVNRPMAIGKYRLYQNSYKQDYLLEVASEKDTVIMPFNTAFNFNQQVVLIREFDHASLTFLVEVERREYRIPPGEITVIAGQKIRIEPLGPKYTSILEVADVTGLNILAIFGLMYLILLAYIFWWKQNN